MPLTRASALLCMSFGLISTNLYAQPQTTPKAVRVEPTQASRWALLIGVDDYAEATDLKYCGADMRALREQLIANGFLADQVFLLHDDAKEKKYLPIKANIERQLGLLLDLVQKGHVLLIAFSGHGVHLGKTSYLCPTEARIEHPETLVSLDAVYEKLNESPATLKLVMVDACRNDPRLQGEKSLDATTIQFAEALERQEPPEGLMLFNSCTAGETSWEEKDFGHGVFIHFVMEGLRGAADADGDGKITLNEISTFAANKTKIYVARKFNRSQRPFLRGDMTLDALNYDLFQVTAAGNSSPSPSVARTKHDAVQLQIISPEGMQICGKNSKGHFTDAKSWKTPAKINLTQGSRFRFKFQGIPEFHGRCLYPLLEIRPKTPASETFFETNALVLEFTEEEFDAIFSGRPLIKVLFNPGPDFLEEDKRRRENERGTTAWVSSFMLPPGTDPILEADRRGDVLAVLELGNVDLEPDANSSEPSDQDDAQTGELNAEAEAREHQRMLKYKKIRDREASVTVDPIVDPIADEVDDLPDVINADDPEAIEEQLPRLRERIKRLSESCLNLPMSKENATTLAKSLSRLALKTEIAKNTSGEFAALLDLRMEASKLRDRAQELTKPMKDAYVVRSVKKQYRDKRDRVHPYIGYEHVPLPVPRPDSTSAPVNQARPTQLAYAQSLGVDVIVENSIGMILTLIPSGEFWMGSPKTENGHDDTELRHRVIISKPFYIGAYEVTQNEYEQIMQNNPSRSSTKAGEEYPPDNGRLPVDEVSWENAREFCRRLSSLPAEDAARRVYRLPTEAEWEYACRAGTTTPFHFGDQLNGREATCDGSRPYGTAATGPSRNSTTRVGSYTPNAFGLYDMHGNVWEWCADWYDEDYYRTSPTTDPPGPSSRRSGIFRVVRGGGLLIDPSNCRSSYRFFHSPLNGCPHVGFRVVCDM
ncbi:MAG TPA: SUMF1/EgtB/PvdO family nonheme iron enzyme [Pirellulales bacterium]|nr:SUMF1/EgtB/PvdO family nonheme iron enzyme [Pirellulales bacterium]